MLDPQTIATIKTTLPTLLAIGPTLTADFYERMFTHNPELKNIFNMSNQRNGNQPEALFHAICAYVTHIENLHVLLPAVEKIAQKHTSFAFQADHYEIVGKHLLATLDEKLNPGTEVLVAWGKAYKLLADLFIKREEDIYRENQQKTGGWRGLRTFHISKIETESETIKSVILTPADGREVADYHAGQYIGLWLNATTLSGQKIRQYSLTHAPNRRDYRIAVRHEPEGKVSTWLHQQAKVGDEVHLTPPAGDFFMNVSANTSVTLISAGAGQTPMLSMLDTLVRQQHPADVQWFHAARDGKHHAFREEVAIKGAQLANFSQHLWYETPSAEDAGRYDSAGLMDLRSLIPESDESGRTFYLCGPLGFMQHVARQLVDIGISKPCIHYEVFGPHNVI